MTALLLASAAVVAVVAFRRAANAGERRYAALHAEVPAS